MVPLALGLYALWTALTYLLEGLPRTLLRPEATGLRLAYALVANVGVGVVGSAWVLRGALRRGELAARAAGFRGARAALAGAAAGAILGLAFYLAQAPPSRAPMVIVNGVSQLLPTSAAEVLVCWAVLGAAVERALRARRVPLPAVWAAVVASAAFGLHHVAHSPPFNTAPFVALLAGIGMMTSVFFFVARDVYGTLALHGFFGLFGVLDALRRAELLAAYERPLPPLVGTAAVTVAVLVALHAAWLRPPAR
jgi:hypothetical protein